MSLLTILLYLTGAFAVVLGMLHFTFPQRFGFLQVIPLDGDPVPAFRLGFYRHELARSDLRGIIYVMNHCVSYAIVSAGIFDLFAAHWLNTSTGALGAGVVAGFWLLRARTQFYLGHRRGDWLVAAWFSLLGLVHLVAVTNLVREL
jgi:hypothetical protein